MLLVSHALIEGPLVVRRLFEAGADVVLTTQRDLEGELIRPDPVDAILVDAAADDPVRIVERIRAITETPVGIIIDPRQRPLLPDLQAAGYGSYLVKPVRSRSLLVAVRTLIGEAGFDGLAADAVEPEEAEGLVAERSLNVLLCDDNEINLLLGRGLVEKLGSRVVTAADGRRAVAAVEESLRSGDAFDLILMDLHMPEMDGVEAARRIRTLAEELAPGRPAPRILALTADVMSATRERCEAGLFDAWLGKPLLPAQLRAALDGVGKDTD